MTARLFREARVDLGAIAHNITTLRAATGPGLKMVVVKSRGYGHGAVPVARAAESAGADWLGVVSIEEALELRAAGIRVPILAWLHDPDASFDDAIAGEIDLGVSYLHQLDRIAAAPGVAAVQLKIDTGLGRNGASAADWTALVEAAAAHERAGRITVRAIWSHLANSGEAADLEQVAAFDDAVVVARAAGLSPQLLHLAATAGALRVPSSRYDLVRLGIGVYGLSPFDNATSADLGLRPALELSAAVALVKRVPAGSGISYGHDYRTTAETTLALVPLGYGDGVPRHASGRGPVTIGGIRYPVAGRIAMDQLVVDVGDAAVSVGDRAVLFGDPATGAPSADDWAAAADTINYEIVTRLGGRIERTYTR
jgi:alanine racemase